MRIKILKTGFFSFLCMLLISCQEKNLYTTTGYVEGNFIYLSSQQGGYLQELLVVNGQKVKKGQLLAKLNPQPQQSQTEAARAKWRETQENLSELQKNKSEGYKYKVNAAKAAVDGALADLKAAKWAYDIKNIYADFSGEIKDIFYQQSEYVPSQYPILSLFVPGKMKIVFYVPETHLNKIKSGKEISIVLEDKKYISKINYLSPNAEYTPEAIFSERNRYKLVYKVKAVLPLNLKDVLKPGQPVEINYE